MTWLRDYISSQSLLTLVFSKSENNSLLDIWVTDERFLDLLQLDALPTDLYLEIFSSQKLDRPIWTVAPQISCPIQSLSRLGMLYKFFAGTLLICPIPLGYSDTRTIHLSPH